MTAMKPSLVLVRYQLYRNKRHHLAHISRLRMRWPTKQRIGRSEHGELGAILAAKRRDPGLVDPGPQELRAGAVGGEGFAGRGALIFGQITGGSGHEADQRQQEQGRRDKRRRPGRANITVLPSFPASNSALVTCTN